VATRARILRTAEQLFAERGIDGVSTREILKSSGVNAAAIHYHFGSKSKLVEDLLISRLTDLAEKQIHYLQQAEAAQAPSPEAVVECFTRPILEITDEPDGEYTMRFLAEAANHPDFMDSYLENSAVTFNRKVAMVARIAPLLDNDEAVTWTRYASTLAFRVLGSRVYTSDTHHEAGKLPDLEQRVTWFLLLALRGAAWAGEGAASADDTCSPAEAREAGRSGSRPPAGPSDAHRPTHTTPPGEAGRGVATD
jgi:AcrR family transcriptional regulator